jgi:hypothetical protein
MHELELTFRRILSIWWLGLWRTLVGATLLGALAAVATKLIVVIVSLVIAGGDAPNYPSEASTQLLGMIAGGLLGLWWAIVVFRMAFRKKYRDFRIALIARESNQPISN